MYLNISQMQGERLMTDHEIRQRVLQIRQQWPKSLRKEASVYAAQNLLAMSEWQQAHTVFCFLSFGL